MKNNFNTALFFWGFVLIFDQASGKQFTLERQYKNPSLEVKNPEMIHFSYDSKWVAFLKPKSNSTNNQSLYLVDLKTQKKLNIFDSDKMLSQLKKIESSESEKARLERQRISSEGLVEYHWAHQSNSILIPFNNRIYLWKNNLQDLGLPNETRLDLKYSSKDNYISYIKGRDLYIYDLKNKKEWAVTHSKSVNVSYGVAEFVAQEEMNRFTGYWWSEDEKYIALIEVDETNVQEVLRHDISASSIITRQQKYPEAGTANAKLRLAVISVENILKQKLEYQWIKIDEPDYYIPRVSWTPQNDLSFQIQSRDQKKLQLITYNPVTQKSQTVYKEKHDRWINLNDSLYWFKNSDQFIWMTEKSGFPHLVLMNRSGKILKNLTEGEWSVDELIKVDEAQKVLYFTAGLEKTDQKLKANPVEKQLFKLNYETLELSQLSDQTAYQKGFHEIEISPDKKFYVDTYSSTHEQPQITIFSINGDKILTLKDFDHEKIFAEFKNDFVYPEIYEFETSDHKNKKYSIFYSLYKPKDFNPQKKYPLIVYSYGGPTSQQVQNAWRRKYFFLANHFVQKGFLFATIDNRGSVRRGRDFSDAIYQAFGSVEVEDQKKAVQHLIDKGFVDRKNMGFMGWSYGGYLALMLAMKEPQFFKAHVAIAPVTDFKLYDTHYTERYLGQPWSHKKVFESANVLNFTSNLDSKLLVMHGMSDDNVLFSHSTLLFKKLQSEGKLFESQSYPGLKHGLSGDKNQYHVFKTIIDFFERHLQNK